MASFHYKFGSLLSKMPADEEYRSLSLSLTTFFDTQKQAALKKVVQYRRNSNAVMPPPALARTVLVIEDDSDSSGVHLSPLKLLLLPPPPPLVLRRPSILRARPGRGPWTPPATPRRSLRLRSRSVQKTPENKQKQKPSLPDPVSAKRLLLFPEPSDAVVEEAGAKKTIMSLETGKNKKGVKRKQPPESKTSKKKQQRVLMSSIRTESDTPLVLPTDVDMEVTDDDEDTSSISALSCIITGGVCGVDLANNDDDDDVLQEFIAHRDNNNGYMTSIMETGFQFDCPDGAARLDAVPMFTVDELNDDELIMVS